VGRKTKFPSNVCHAVFSQSQWGVGRGVCGEKKSSDAGWGTVWSAVVALCVGRGVRVRGDRKCFVFSNMKQKLTFFI
jgi:hypothetical protein